MATEKNPSPSTSAEAVAATTPRRSRKQVVVDVGDKREAMEAAARAADVSLSTWLRRAITHELAAAGHPTAATASGHPPTPQPSSQPILPLITLAERDLQTSGAAPRGKPLRLQLDAPTAQRLEAYRRRGHFRTRPAALRFALHAATAADAIDVAPLANAVAALIRSNNELGPIGRVLNQIARALNSAMGRVGQSELDHLNVFVPEVRKHLTHAVHVAHLLDAFITPQRPGKKAGP